MTTVGQIIANRAAAEGWSVKRLLTLNTRPEAWARQDAMRAARDQTGKSLPEIGRIFGRDHTTVLYSVRASAARWAGETYRKKPSTAGKRS